METTEIVVVGAGVVGLAVAARLSRSRHNIIILEKHDSFGRETSSRNSEVVHGGMYYPRDSLKARLCVRGRVLLYDFCFENEIPFRKTGKLIVAVDGREIPALEDLRRQGEKNGVEGLSMLDGRELSGLEPACRGVAGLYSPETGILDSHRLMQAFLDIAGDNGAICAFDSEVVSIEREDSSYILTVKNGEDTVRIASSIVINACGLDSDTVAEKAGFDVDRLGYRLQYCKGQYFRVAAQKAALVKRLVYPVPAPAAGGLGVHVTPDLGGGLRLGPDDRYLPGREKDYTLDEGARERFHRSVKPFLPCIDENDLSPDTAGIRPKLQTEGGAFRDFVIREESDHGFPGFVNLIGIESPGLTSCMSIAETVGSLLKA